MNCISIIKAQNNFVAARTEAEATTHWVELPTGQTAISVTGTNGKPQKGLISAEDSALFQKALGNHDGVKPLWQHRQAVCRRFVKRAAK